MRGKIKYFIPPILIIGIILICMIFIINAYILAIATLGEFTQNTDTVDVGTKNLDADVERYREKVTAEANSHNKGEYVSLFLAVMMQESHGQGNDVYQCSVYLGKSIEDVTVDESIQGGVELLSSNLDAASVNSPQDIINIRLALQGYNFGNGYIQWALERDGKWTQENTNEFAKIHSNGKTRSKKKAKTMGKWAYGDQYYTDHVLRYYDLADNNSDENPSNDNGTDKAEVVKIAKKLVGCSYDWGACGNDMKFDCSGLVFYCYKNAGYKVSRMTADGYCKSVTKINEEDLQPGDLIFYHKKKSDGSFKAAHHVAIYVGNGMIVHAKSKKCGVVYDQVTYGSSGGRTFGRMNVERKQEN